MDDFSETTSIEELETTRTEAIAAAEALAERARNGEALSAAERAELRGHLDRRDAVDARIAELNTEAEAATAEQDDLLSRLAPAEEPQTPEATAEETAAEPEVPAEPIAEEAPVTVPDTVAAAVEGLLTAVTANIQTHSAEAVVAAGEVPRGLGVRPSNEPPLIEDRGDAWGATTTLVATGVVSGVGIGTEMDFDAGAAMLARRFASLPKPKLNPRAKVRNLQFTPLLDIQVTRPSEFVLTGDPVRDSEIMQYAVNQSRLQGANGEVGLVAAGGWCAPSTIMYDIPVVGESLDGMVSIPEVQAPRGGIQSTTGPDFATLYANIGFHQTEAQAIAGVDKTCYVVPCPSFTETRMDVEGVCLIVPILTEAGYPELIRRYLSGATVVHAHKVNAFKLSKIAAGSTAVDTTSDGLGSTAHDTLSALELRADFIRSKYRMRLDETLEVVLPHWIRSYLRQDLQLRPGADPTRPITNADLQRYFAASGLAVQFVYDWQDMTDPHSAPPADFDAAIYPAGTWLALTKDVINLSSVYDSAGLVENQYLGTFSEEGVGVRKMSGVSELVTIPICSKGTVGATEFTCTAA